MYYFAYGSNMDMEDLARWCAERGRREVRPLSERPATLAGYDLVFNHFAGKRGGGAANIAMRENSSVRGVLFEIDKEDLKTLRMKEGYDAGVYDEIDVSVECDDGTIFEGARTYILRPDMEQERQVKPTEEYRATIVKGARDFGLDSEWIARLESLPTAPKSDEPQYF